jgi:hypothetical protein
MQAAARTLGVQIHVIQANSDADFDAVFASVRNLRAVALVIVAALPSLPQSSPPSLPFSLVLVYRTPFRSAERLRETSNGIKQVDWK